MDDINLLLVGSASALLSFQLATEPYYKINEWPAQLYVRDRDGMPVRQQREVHSCSIPGDSPVATGGCQGSVVYEPPSS